METRYYALRIIALLIKIFAVLVFGGTLVTSCKLLQSGSLSYDSSTAQILFWGGAFLGVLAFLGGTLATLLLWGHAEMIMLHIHIEENTRESAINSRRERERIDHPVRRNMWEDP